MLWPTIEALKALGGSGTNQEIVDKLAEFAGYTEEQLSVLHGSGPATEVAYRAAWARTYLKSVGALVNSARSVWALTDLGRSMTQEDMTAIPARVRAMPSTRPRRRTRDESPAPPAAEDTPVAPQPDQDWRDSLLAVVQGMPPAAFERLAQRLLRESGFTKVEVTGRSGDGGIDGIGVLRVNLLSFQVLFQCKRYRGSVPPKEIRDFRGAMVGRTDKGLFITTGNFTRDAVQEATRDGAPPIDLIDGHDLCTLLKDLHLGVNVEQVEQVTVDNSWFSTL